jgi:hypothetical protein
VRPAALLGSHDVELLSGKNLCHNLVHSKCVADFLRGRRTVAGEQNQAIDSHASHRVQRFACLGARPVAEQKAAEAAPAVCNEDLRCASVLSGSRVGAKLDQGPSPEDGLLSSDRRDHSEARLLLEIFRRRAWDPAPQRFSHDGARYRVQGTETTRRRDCEHRIFRFTGNGPDLSDHWRAHAHGSCLVED